MINEYDGNGRIVGRHLPPRHFKLSYLVTAWTQRPEDEHRLLSALLACFLRHDAIPPELLAAPLADLGLPVPLTVGLPPPEDRAFADVWSALGGELKPSLDVVVTAPTDTGQRRETGPPVVLPPRTVIGWPGRVARGRSRGPAGRTEPSRASWRAHRVDATGPASGSGTCSPGSRWSRRGSGRWSSTGAATTRRRTTRSAAST